MMKGVAAGLRELVEKVDVIGASLLRAQQTAQIIAEAYHDLPVATVEDLLPDSDPPALMAWLQQHATVNVVIRACRRYRQACRCPVLPPACAEAGRTRRARR